MEGDEPLPPPAPTLLATSIATLHPDNDDRDVLPREEDDPVDCLQLSTDNIRNHIYRLNCDSSSGSTGWTNTLLRRLCDDRDSASLRITDTPPLPIHIALTRYYEVMSSAKDTISSSQLVLSCSLKAPNPSVPFELSAL